MPSVEKWWRQPVTSVQAAVARRALRKGQATNPHVSRRPAKGLVTMPLKKAATRSEQDAGHLAPGDSREDRDREPPSVEKDGHG